jgi:hypothetical protein
LTHCGCTDNIAASPSLLVLLGQSQRLALAIFLTYQRRRVTWSEATDSADRPMATRGRDLAGWSALPFFAWLSSFSS